MESRYDLILHQMPPLIDDDFRGDSNVTDSTSRHAEDYICQEFAGQTSCYRTIG
jgi:hypothetical protein